MTLIGDDDNDRDEMVPILAGPPSQHQRRENVFGRPPPQNADGPIFGSSDDSKRGYANDADAAAAAAAEDLRKLMITSDDPLYIMSQVRVALERRLGNAVFYD